MTADPPRLATYLGRDDATSSAQDGVFGRDLAIDEFLGALLRFGAGGRYQFFHAPDRTASRNVHERVHGRIELLASQRDDIEPIFSDVASLRRSPEKFDFRAWHEPDADLDIIADVRANYSRRLYPLTTTSHVLSYPGLAHGWYLRMMLQDLHACDALVCTSQAARVATLNQFRIVAERLRRSHGMEISYGGRVEVIPLGIDTALFQPATDKVGLRRELGLPENAFILLWLGRLSFIDKADLLPLVQIFQRLVAVNPSRNLLLLIAGTGRPAFGAMVRRCAEALGIASRVRVIEPLPPGQRHLFHAAADVFVSPADNVQETFGITPIEAMACGVPQVVSDWSGYRDTVVDGVTGFLIPTYLAGANSDACLASGLLDECDLTEHLMLAQSTVVDPYAFQHALQQLVDSDALRQRMAEASRRRAISEYDWRCIISSYESLWTELASVAAHLPYDPSPHAHYAVPAFVEVFGHYATSILQPDTRLEVSDAGWRVLRGVEALPLFTESLGVISHELALLALRLLGTATGLVLGDAIERVSIGAAESRDRAGRHVMWLMKYGLIQAR